ncbi:exonuclease VIII [Arthrobacter phage Persistence]|uniref:RecB-like exonuclease/helicase n=1 Tax=Arthrobacter phage Persistence TaxID=2836007 RepID=A0A8F3ILJ4_9CAUD|nr:exonuclease VIII [Arthrobacter phage Persistence]QWY79690.1 RecB-like exonuclease/helicase [Arthrobacter phage Persistence]
MGYSPGIYPDITNRDYHADKALGSTSLKTLATRTPAHWKWESEHPVHKDAYDIGTVTHSLILEGDESGVKVIDVPDKRGTKWTGPADEAKAEGLIPLTTKDMDLIRGMRDSVMAHPIARAALTGHRAEHSVFWEEEGQMFKCRPDAWNNGKLWDLKTTINADPREFGKTAHNYGYHQSNAHYVDGVAVATGETLPFGFILVEKTEPYLVSVVELDWEAIDLGRALNDRAKRIYRECSESGNWPGYAPAEPISLPTYAVYDTEDLLGIDNDPELKL